MHPLLAKARMKKKEKMEAKIPQEEEVGSEIYVVIVDHVMSCDVI